MTRKALSLLCKSFLGRCVPGYTAITTAIITSIVIMLLGVSIAFISLSGRTATLNFTVKQRATYLAQACLEEALLKLANDPNYIGNETIQVQIESQTEPCSIGEITTSGANKIIPTQALFSSFSSSAATKLRLTVQASDLAWVSLVEVP